MTSEPFKTAATTDRPLLARVADSTYWMSRYIERVEHVARILKINTNILMDVGDVDEAMRSQQWQNILQIGHPGAKPAEAAAAGRPIGEFVPEHLTFDPTNSSSILSCIATARENGRAIRSEISAEMWEQLNQRYWWITSDEARTRFEEQPEEFYNTIIAGSMLFQGITAQTLAHDQRWMFIDLGKSMERIDITARIVEARYKALHAVEDDMEDSLWNIQWMAVLRMCCSIEAYRRQFPGDFDPLKVAGFVILEDQFPRSIRYSVGRCFEAMQGIRRATGNNSLDPAERIFGKLAARLAYADLAEIASVGVEQYLRTIQLEVAQANGIIQQTYFQK